VAPLGETKKGEIKMKSEIFSCALFAFEQVAKIKLTVDQAQEAKRIFGCELAHEAENSSEPEEDLYDALSLARSRIEPLCQEVDALTHAKHLKKLNELVERAYALVVDMSIRSEGLRIARMPKEAKNDR
jgi:hypothetical protein